MLWQCLLFPWSTEGEQAKTEEEFPFSYGSCTHIVSNCITLTAKGWMNHSYRFCFPPFFCFFYIPYFVCAQLMCFVGQWIKVSVWSFTVRLSFFHYVKPQHITVSQKKKKTRHNNNKNENTEMKDDHRSYIHNFYSWEKKAWKKFRFVRDSNPWPLRY